MLWLFGGNANNGSICSLSASNANNVFSNANSNIGAQLTFKHDFEISQTLPLKIREAKNKERQTVLVGILEDSGRRKSKKTNEENRTYLRTDLLDRKSYCSSKKRSSW
jgi:hypothetical protein